MHVTCGMGRNASSYNVLRKCNHEFPRPGAQPTNQTNKQQQNQPCSFPVSLNHGSSLWSGNKDSLGKMKFFLKMKYEVKNAVVLKIRKFYMHPSACVWKSIKGNQKLCVVKDRQEALIASSSELALTKEIDIFFSSKSFIL